MCDRVPDGCGNYVCVQVVCVNYVCVPGGCVNMCVCVLGGCVVSGHHGGGDGGWGTPLFQ